MQLADNVKSELHKHTTVHKEKKNVMHIMEGDAALEITRV